MPRPTVFRVKVHGDVAFAHALRKFNARDRILIIMKSMRATLRPGAVELRGATPRAVGSAHLQGLARKNRRGWVSTPYHTADAARSYVRKSTKYGSITGRLGYRPGFSWYMHIQTVGFTSKAGRRIAPKPFASNIIDKYEKAAFIELPQTIKKLCAKQIVLNHRRNRRRGRK